MAWFTTTRRAFDLRRPAGIKPLVADQLVGVPTVIPVGHLARWVRRRLVEGVIQHDDLRDERLDCGNACAAET
jgi:hypothetical protein